MPQTLTDWILFAAIVASAMSTVFTGSRLIMTVSGKVAPDRQDIHAAYASGVLLAFSILLFLLVEGLLFDTVPSEIRAPIRSLFPQQA